MYSAFLALALMGSPEPASFTFTIEGNKDCSVMFGETVLKSGVVYRTEPLYNEATVTLEVRWVDGDEIIRQKLTLSLLPGRHGSYTITVPRGYPTIRLCLIVPRDSLQTSQGS